MQNSNSCRFLQQFQETWPVLRWQSHRTIVAVSGGADSVALACAMQASAIDPSRLHLAHFNHQWRGTASDADERFVQQLADQLKITFHVERADAQPAIQSISEATARDARYDFLTRVANQIGARYIVTAHTQDDQVETILHRIIRGTGLAGLKGIPPFRSLSEAVTLARPMLEISRAEVINFLEQIQQSYQVDQSNFDTQFTRNKIRLKLLPYMREHFGGHISQNLLKLSQQADAVQSIIGDQVQPLIQSSVRQASNQIVINSSQLRSQPIHILRELIKTLWQQQDWPLRNMSFDHWNELANAIACEAVETQSIKMYPGEIQVVADANKLCFKSML